MNKNQYGEKIMTVEIEKVIIEMYLSGKTANEILRHLGGVFKTKKSVYDVLHLRGIKGRNRTDYTIIDHDYFRSVETSEKAYLLGWIITDGWVYKKKNNLGLCVQSGDVAIIDFMKKQLKTDVSVSTRPAEDVIVNGQVIHRGEMKQLVVSSPVIVKDLERFGVIARKSPVTYLPLFDTSLMWHMVRGIFDGDGSASIEKDGKVSIHFYGSHYLMAQLSMWLYQQAIIDGKSLKYTAPYTHKKTTISQLQYFTVEDCTFIASKMYANSNIETRLERKHKLIVEAGYANS